MFSCVPFHFSLYEEITHIFTKSSIPAWNSASVSCMHGFKKWDKFSMLQGLCSESRIQQRFGHIQQMPAVRFSPSPPFDMMESLTNMSIQTSTLHTKLWQQYSHVSIKKSGLIMWYCFEVKPWWWDKKRRLIHQLSHILKAVIRVDVWLLQWDVRQVCCDLCEFHCMILVLMTDVRGIIFNFLMCSNILGVKWIYIELKNIVVVFVNWSCCALYFILEHHAWADTEEKQLFLANVRLVCSIAGMHQASRTHTGKGNGGRGHRLVFTCRIFLSFLWSNIVLRVFCSNHLCTIN